MSLTADPATADASVAPPTVAESGSRSPAAASRWRDIAVAFALSMALAAPWIWQQLVPLEWLAVAAGLLFLPRLGGWWGETLVLVVATTALTTAFHWSPEVLAGSLESSYAVGLAFTIPFIIWDALRLWIK